MELSPQSGLGDVHGCNEWNTCYEEKISKSVGSGLRACSKHGLTPTLLNDVENKDILRTSTGFGELDRVLGGGLVKGSLTLLGGEPGIRKIYFNFANL